MNKEGVQIIGYDDRYAKDFAHLNYLWLQKYFEPEDEDLILLSNPQSEIIDKGGFIFLVREGEDVVGTAAFIKMEEDVFELAKMTVIERLRGQKMGQRLLSHCIDFARQNDFKKIILYSNRTLKPALHLYRKYGFKEVEMEGDLFTRADIMMELDLKKE